MTQPHRSRESFPLFGLLCALFFALGSLVLGCRAPSGPARPSLEAISNAHATGFRLLRGSGFTLAEVTRPWPGATDTLRYLLVPRGAVVPAGYGGVPVVRTPVRRVVALSTTHLAMLDKLGQSQAVVGVASADLVFTPAVRARLASGAALPVGEGDALALETVAALDPDLVLMSSLGGQSGTSAVLESAGIPVVLDGDWAEPTPLGRAEWLRFVAAFFEADARADALVDAIAQRYRALAQQAAAVPTRPDVFVGSAFQGVWHAPGGGSYMAALLADAGAQYLWAETNETGSLALDTEAVLARAQEAAVWLHPGIAPTLDALAAQDSRFRLFSAFQRGAVYNYSGRVSPGGGYDFFETGVVEPDVVLADLIRILHPDVLPAHELVYYRRVE